MKVQVFFRPSGTDGRPRSRTYTNVTTIGTEDLGTIELTRTPDGDDPVQTVMIPLLVVERIETSEIAEE